MRRATSVPFATQRRTDFGETSRCSATTSTVNMQAHFGNEAERFMGESLFDKRGG